MGSLNLLQVCLGPLKERLIQVAQASTARERLDASRPDLLKEDLGKGLTQIRRTGGKWISAESLAEDGSQHAMSLRLRPRSRCGSIYPGGGLY